MRSVSLSIVNLFYVVQNLVKRIKIFVAQCPSSTGVDVFAAETDGD